MQRKSSWHKKLGLVGTFIVAAALPFSLYLFLTETFDVRNYASTPYAALIGTTTKKYTVDLTKEDSTIETSVALLNQGNETVLKAGHKLLYDDSYLQFQGLKINGKVVEPSSIGEEDSLKVIKWDNLLPKCSNYPCEGSLLPGKVLDGTVTFKPLGGTSTLEADKTEIYSAFTDIVATEESKVPSNITTLPVTGETVLGTSTAITLAETGENQSPVCDTLDINGPMNPSALITGHTIPFIARGRDSDDGIEKVTAKILKISAGEDEETIKEFTWEIEANKQPVIKGISQDPEFNFEFTETGTYEVQATFIDTAGKMGSCNNDNSLDLKVVDSNSAPTFSTNPEPDKTASQPLDQGEKYQYSTKAKDSDKDGILYEIISQPSWLNFSSTSNTDGAFDGLFNGTPTSDEHAGTHPIVYYITDGYSGHAASQIWVLRVNTKDNDIPQVLVEKPTRAAYTNNQALSIEWKASDKNTIKEFDLYYAQNPAKRSSWTLIKENLASGTTSFNWTTPTGITGDYYIIVEATDNSDDALSGFGISEIFSIGTGKVPEQTSQDGDTIRELFAEISNVTPEENSKTVDNKPIISADLRASKGALIDGAEIAVLLDNKEISDLAEVKGTGEATGSVLVNLEDGLKKGSHKVTITMKDSEDQIAIKTWTFTVTTPLEGKDKPTEQTTTKVLDIAGLKIKLDSTTILIITIVVAVILIALLIPWLIYFLQNRSGETNGNGGGYGTYTEISQRDPEAVPAVAPDTSTTYVDPAQYTQTTNVTQEPAVTTETTNTVYQPVPIPVTTEQPPVEPVVIQEPTNTVMTNESPQVIEPITTQSSTTPVETYTPAPTEPLTETPIESPLADSNIISSQNVMDSTVTPAQDLTNTAPAATDTAAMPADTTMSADMTTETSVTPVQTEDVTAAPVFDITTEQTAAPEMTAATDTSMPMTDMSAQTGIPAGTVEDTNLNHTGGSQEDPNASAPQTSL